MKSPVKKIREKLDVTQKQLTRVVLDSRNDVVLRSLETGRSSLDVSYNVERGPTAADKKETYIFLKKLSVLMDIDFGLLLKKQKEFEKSEIQKVREKMSDINFDLG